jgi:copper transport outer membrane protein MctB
VIDFRYHLVSIVAVFLALAIGIVVGATALKPKTEEVLDNESRIAQHQITTQRTAIKNLELEIASDDALAQAAAPRLLAGLLEGQRIVLVTAPGADNATISGITSDLNRAGAKVAGQVQLQNPFFDTTAAGQNKLDVLASKVAPSSVTPGYPSAQAYVNAQIAGQQEAAQVLAPALVTKSATDLSASQTSQILDGFAQQGFLQFSPSSGSVAPPQATLAVVVIPGNPPSSADANPSNLALLSLAQQLALNSRGVVLAGSLTGSLTGSGPGSAIDELINGSTGIRTQVSSVDDADHASGQLIVAQALSYLLNGQKPKAYGVSSALVPDPAPTPAPSATSPATPTPTTSPVRKNRA